MKASGTGNHPPKKLAVIPCHAFSEDSWEQYAMGKLYDPDCAALEQHLLVCRSCQDLLQKTDEFIEAMRIAAAPINPRRTRRSLSKAMAAASSLTIVLTFPRI